MYDPIHCGLLSGTSPHPDSPHAAPAPCDRGPGAGRIAPRCLQIAALLACSAAVLLLATPRPRSHCADETACLFASPPGAVLSRTVRGPGVALRGGGGRPHNSGSPVSIAVPTRADARAAVPVPPDPEAKGNPLEQLWGYPFWPVQLALGALMGLLGRRWWARPRRPEAPAEAPPLPPAPRADISRRQWLQGAAAGAAATATTAPAPAAAAGLITKFPPDSLNNVYLLMRSGEGQYEADGVVRHNPVLNTNLAGRLTKEGKRQAIRGMSAIKGLRIDPDTIWIWPSITARAYETGEILAQGLGVPRSRLVPEFTFLDARGFGSYEGQALDKLSEVYAADQIDTSIRPPPFTDGTPNESVNDVFVRVVQLLSKLETQYQGVTVIIVSPDSDNLTVLQAAMTGLDMRQNHALDFAPGEVRMLNLTGSPPAAEEDPDEPAEPEAEAAPAKYYP